MTSPLEAVLESYLSVGRCQSQGKFTLDLKSALGNLGNYQLPRPTAWVLKIVQAAVAAGASSINVIELGNLIVIDFDGQEHWTLDSIEQGLSATGAGGQPGFEHLKRGLWQLLSITSFFLSLPNINQSLRWSGAGFERIKTEPVTSVRLSISRRPPGSSGARESRPPKAGGISWLKEAISNLVPDSNRISVSSELHASAHLCPVPLILNGFRVDRPELTLQPMVYPLQLLAADAEIPKLSLAPADRNRRGLNPDPRFRSGAIAKLDAPPPQFNVLILLNANVEVRVSKGPGRGRTTTLIPKEGNSQICWVLDGVVVDHTSMNHRGVLSCLTYVSAKDLPLDISGFKLLESTALEERLRRVRFALATRLRESKGEFIVAAAKRIPGARRFSAVMLLLGFLTLPVVIGVFILMSCLVRLVQDERFGLVKQLKKSWAHLLEACPVQGVCGVPRPTSVLAP